MKQIFIESVLSVKWLQFLYEINKIKDIRFLWFTLAHAHHIKFLKINFLYYSKKLI